MESFHGNYVLLGAIIMCEMFHWERHTCIVCLERGGIGLDNPQEAATD